MTPSELENEIADTVSRVSWIVKPMHSEYFGKMAVLQVVLTAVITALVLAVSRWFGLQPDGWMMLALIVPIHAVVWATTVLFERWLETDVLEDVFKAKERCGKPCSKPGHSRLRRP